VPVQTKTPPANQAGATASIWNGDFIKKLPNQIQAVAHRKLRMANNARQIDDLSISPNNRMELLSENRVRQ